MKTMVTLTDLGKNLIDAHERHQEIKIEFPEYANAARQIIINYLKEYDTKALSVYLGKTEDDYEDGHTRHWLYLLQKDICSYIEDIETNVSECGQFTGIETISGYQLRWDNCIRERLGLTLRIVSDDTIEEVKHLLSYRLK